MSIARSPDGWRKSRYSQNGGNCVEVNTVATPVGVRDTKDRAGGQLAIPGTAWRALIEDLTRA